MASLAAVEAARLRYPVLKAELNSTPSENGQIEVNPAQIVVIKAFEGRSLDDETWESSLQPDGLFINDRGDRLCFVLRKKSGKIKRNISALTFSLMKELLDSYAGLYTHIKETVDPNSEFANGAGSLGPDTRNSYWLKLIGSVQRLLTEADRKELFDALRDPRLYQEDSEQLPQTEIPSPKTITTSEKSFSYKPLAKVANPIRLAVLLPAKERSASIKCLLCNELLSNNPDYEALSYTWGDASQTRPIEVDGKTFHAAETLVSALRQLRYKKEGKVRVLWIDALCINQNDNGEKGQQVRQMTSVYGQASQVVIWLGLESNTSTRAINFLHELTTTLGRESQHKDIVPSSTFGGRLSHLHPFYNDNWSALVQFFLRPYWNRVWILQELAVAKEAVFYCGGATFSWYLLGSLDIITEQLLAMNVHNPKRKHPFSHDHYDTMSRVLHVVKMVSLRMGYLRSKQEGGISLPIPWLLTHSHGRLVTELRDYVYGILGMASEEERASEHLRPDYSLGVHTVFIRTAKHILHKYRNLDMLTLMGSYFEWEDCAQGPGGKWVRQPVHFGFPSWVPLWGLYLTNHARILRDGIFDPVPAGEKPLKVFNAAPEISPVPFLIGDFPPSLTVAGIRVDVITGVEHPPKHSGGELNKRSFRPLIKHLRGKPYYGGQSLEEAYWRTIFTDRWSAFVLTGVNTWPHEVYEMLGSEIPGISHIPPACPSEEAKLTENFYKLSPKNLDDRSFIVSENGFIGLAPADVAIGDLIVVLFGGRVPFILREAWGSAHLLVGERYDPQYS